MCAQKIFVPNDRFDFFYVMRRFKFLQPSFRNRPRAFKCSQCSSDGMYKETPKADREFGQESALDVGACEISGESVDLTIWKDSGQKKNWEGLGKTMGCAFGKAFGITSFDYVDGGLWTISGTSETLANEVANKMDAKAVHVDC